MVSWKRIGIVLAAVLASLALTGAGQVSPVTSGPENQAAAHAVAVATGRADGTMADLVPPDFAEVMGYTPELVLDGVGVRVIDPAGNCSSPAGSAGYDFDRACRFHDYGYDLLRYAADRGGELGPWARMAIDDQFGVDLRAHCADPGGSPGCRAAAWAGEHAVRINSWRQGYGVPGVENPLPYVAAGVLLLTVCVGPRLAGRLHRACVTVATRSGCRAAGTAK